MSRIDDLIAAMTLAEKLGQLTMTTAGYAVTGPVATTDLQAGILSGQIGNVLNLYGADAIKGVQKLALEQTRLKIPLLVGMDVIHGHRTIFPIPLGETSLFDPAAWEATAREAAREAAADGVHLTFAPMLDVARDPRWGRIAEGPGEDPLVGQAIARAKVKGFQGASLAATDTLAACAKHYCAYSAVTAGREYAPTDVSQRSLHEIYLPPFEAAVAAGVATIMPAFTDLDGVPMTANSALLKDYLRGKLNFQGVLVSDYNAIAELIHHGVAADLADAAALALKAGVDMDMMANAYRDGLPMALKRGLITMADIDASVRRVLTLKEQLGLFDNPYGRGSVESAEVLASRRALARDAAARSVVMLKNDSATLPVLSGQLAVIGPLADDPGDMRGCWSAAGQPEGCISVLAGLGAALPDQEIAYAQGVTIDGDDESGIAQAAALCDGADTIILCLGESAVMSGEAASRAHPHLPGKQLALAQAVMARATGKRVIAVLFSGRPLVVPEIVVGAGAVLAAWAPGSEAGNALADLLLGKVSPSGKTPVSWPRAVGQIPIFYNQRSGGRPANPNDHYTSKYLDEANAPLFPFGHGLSYGDFVYADLSVSLAQARESDSFTVKVTLINHGLREAGETVFLFIHDKVARVSRPLLELKGFQRISLRPGESGVVTFTLPAEALKYPGLDYAPFYEPGEIEILAGPSADRSRMLSVTVRLI
ncbi:MAG TPA: glycoside hydrolase family 3 N-terminal domain-containing protein [Rhizomicrobium sp.]|nr:glycoside hydrolase family 3 N-terminal domain-containing protein [Rhizomicrobium sp.]